MPYKPIIYSFFAISLVLTVGPFPKKIRPALQEKSQRISHVGIVEQGQMWCSRSVSRVEITLYKGAQL